MATISGNELLGFAGELADAARAVTAPAFRRANAVESKSDDSPVTAIDRAAESAMREMIRRRYPAHGIVGEEMENVNPGADYVWVLDPIDGTRSFISGSPLYCALIAAVYGGRAVVGLIDTPMVGDRWRGICDGEWRAAWCGDSPCWTARGAKALADAVVVTTTLGWRGGEALTRLTQAAGYMQLGGDAFAYGCVAAGFADIAADTAMQTHDYMPLIPIIQGAGGVISDWQGGELTLAGGESQVIAAANPRLHQQAVDVLSRRH